MEMKIKIEHIANPPEKMRLMYEAVAAMIREKKELSTIKVQDITSRAGIGKGTAYEYFSSKTELLSHALIYEYSHKILKLAELVFSVEDFKERCYKIMDWILENKEYNQMYNHLLKVTMGEFMEDAAQTAESVCTQDEFGHAVHDYIYGMIDQFMEDGYRQGVFTEPDAGKRSLALLAAMLEYGLVIMGPKEPRYHRLGDAKLREFIYSGLIASLSL